MNATEQAHTLLLFTLPTEYVVSTDKIVHVLLWFHAINSLNLHSNQFAWTMQMSWFNKSPQTSDIRHGSPIWHTYLVMIMTCDQSGGTWCHRALFMCSCYFVLGLSSSFFFLYIKIKCCSLVSIKLENGSTIWIKNMSLGSRYAKITALEWSGAGH